ncbi:MAG: DUF362 domain-containing protein [Promethearchaeota archaeon]
MEAKEKIKQLGEIQPKILPKKFEYKKNVVALVKLDDYNPENVKKALEKIFDLLDLKGYFKNKKILLKPNLLAPNKLAHTNPSIITELIKILRENENPKEIILGDSSITKGITSVSLKRSKIKALCDQLNVQTFNFFESKRQFIEIKNPEPEIEEGLYLPEEVINSDVLINLPKLKTHKGYVYTGAIKNLFGLLGNKMHMHFVHKIKDDFQKMLADIYFSVEETNKTNFPKVLTIMDSVIAMEGKGPRAGKPRKVGLLIAGFNSAAVDIVGYTLMNGKPANLEAINSLAKRVNLPVDISKLNIIGEIDYKKYIIKNFKKPNIKTLIKSQVPRKGIIAKIYDKAMSISIKINKKKCVLCEHCLRNCPAGAMYRKEDRIFVDYEKCVECFCCGESCPNDAIDAKWYLFRILPYLIGGIALLILIIIYYILTLFGIF